MTDVHAALISPITWVLRIRHILWYAHATNSPYLVWSSFFVSNIISSTVGSCNLKINRKKIKFINQGINEVNFPYRARSFKKLDRFLYYGRLDQSKNIHLLLELVVVLRESNDIITLDIFGKPANLKSEQYISRLISSSKASMLSDIVKFKGSVERRDIPRIARDYEVFINLFTGSLDKTLIEATLMGIPVVTWNKEYCSQFGTWSKTPPKETLEFIIEEIDNLKSSSVLDIQTEIFSRRDQALKNHSFDGWIERLSLELLKSSTP
jgi:glycosyltransferase involved in cell wall biosynthesis